MANNNNNNKSYDYASLQVCMVLAGNSTCFTYKQGGQGWALPLVLYISQVLASLLKSPIPTNSFWNLLLNK